MTAPSSVLVLGIGNILLQDEGLGVHAVERLIERYRLPGEVLVVDGGTLGLDLLPYLQDASAMILLDAIQTGKPESGLIRLEGPEISATLALKYSVHQVGLQELIAASALQGTVPERVVLWGLQPRAIEWGLELSPGVSAQLDNLVDAVVAELRDWGLVPHQESFDEQKHATVPQNHPPYKG
jgi:hydrogenase maturation protease